MLRMIHLRRKRHWVLIPFACLLSGISGRDKSRFERRKICPLQTSLSTQQCMLSDLIEDPHLQSSRMWNTSDPRYSTGMSIPSGKVNNQVIAENDTTGGLRSSLNDNWTAGVPITLLNTRTMSTRALNAILPQVEKSPYEAHQKARTFASRYVKSGQYDTAIDVLFQSARELLKTGQVGSGVDLAGFLLEVYDNKKEPVTGESRSMCIMYISHISRHWAWGWVQVNSHSY